MESLYPPVGDDRRRTSRPDHHELVVLARVQRGEDGHPAAHLHPQAQRDVSAHQVRKVVPPLSLLSVLPRGPVHHGELPQVRPSPHGHVQVRVGLAGAGVVEGVEDQVEVRLLSPRQRPPPLRPPLGQPEHLSHLLRGEVQRVVPLGEDERVRRVELEDI